MATTINTLPSLTVISQEALPVLQKMVPILSAFTTDFSTDIAKEGSAVATRIPSALTAGQYNVASGYAPSVASTTTVTVTLNPVTYAQVGFTDAEIGALTLERLMNTFVKPCIYAVCNKVAADAYALITTGNFGGAAYAGTTYSFANMVSTPLSALQAAGVSSEKALLLNATAYNGLLANINPAYLIGDSNVIREGTIGKLAGVSVLEAAGLPTNSQYIQGAMLGKEAIAIATRLPFIPATAPMIEVATITEPTSELSMQLRTWYSPDKGQYMFGAYLVYGVSLGQSSAGAIITTQ